MMVLEAPLNPRKSGEFIAANSENVKINESKVAEIVDLVREIYNFYKILFDSSDTRSNQFAAWIAR